MTRLQVVAVSVIGGLIFGGAVGAYLASELHILQGGDSPIRVAGGSIHLIEDRGWSKTYTPPSGSCGNVVDVCNYTSHPIDTTKLQIENVKDAAGHRYPVDSPKVISVSGRWTIQVFASKDDGSLDTNGVLVCTSTNVGTCDTGPRNNFVTIKPQPQLSYGFYPNDLVNDKRYHNPSACPNGHCEEMNQIALTMAGSTTYYTCLSSVECKIKIGQ
jgi:hypothetical protein